MRRNQLSFTMEIFDGKENPKLKGYIDANSLVEVMHEMMLESYKIYAKNMSFEEFCDYVRDFNEQRFGRTDIVRIHNK